MRVRMHLVVREVGSDLVEALADGQLMFVEVRKQRRAARDHTARAQLIFLA